jgi:hypothetical protein
MAFIDGASRCAGGAHAHDPLSDRPAPRGCSRACTARPSWGSYLADPRFQGSLVNVLLPDSYTINPP